MMKFTIAAAALVLGVLAAGTSLGGQTSGEPVTFTAFAVDLEGNVPGRNTATVEITIDRWSTPAERQSLTSTLIKEGPEALLRELQKGRPVGRIRTPDSLGYDLRYAYRGPAEDGGERVVIATDRPIGYWEAVNRPRSFDYPFTVIEIHLKDDGTGEGKMSVATKITAVGPDTIALENYDAQPVRLQSVRMKKQ